ncbi:YjbL [Bacillus sp. NRRL B-14911]|nr:YjbL [Bacillus sp. NRRL B-14911]
MEFMNKKIDITNAALTETNELLLETEQDINGLKANGQMLVDSDNLAFVYIAESNDEYTYIVLSEGIWAAMSQALAAGADAYLANGPGRLHLPQFREELGYLIENIKGNSNYGDEMVAKVEAAF